MYEDLIASLHGGAYAPVFERLYGNLAAAQPARYEGALRAFSDTFGERSNVRFFSAPGRSEIGGNHTDHQHGRVLAAAVTLDMIAVVAANGDNIIRMKSDGYPVLKVNLKELSPRKHERNTSHALVRGVAAGLKEAGYTVGGFDAFVVSDVPKGSGLSSSAAYSILVASILSGLYNDGAIPPVQRALAAKLAENHYFGKPSGLMDQLACAEGGFCAIDFADPEHPEIERIDCDPASFGYVICITSAGGSHANLTSEYASIPEEMQTVANFFGKQYLRDVDDKMFYADLPALRRAVSDRAILRAVHFFGENARVPHMVEALRSGDMRMLSVLLTASGDSSFRLLQNVCPSDPKERSVALALALTARLLGGEGGWRIHGGGFAGTILAFMPEANASTYMIAMESMFGAGCCYRLSIRPAGGTEILPSRE